MIRYARLLLPFLLALTLPAAGEDLRAEFIAVKKYPSLSMAPLIRVHIGDSETIKNKLSWPVIHFDPLRLACYRVTDDQGKVIAIRSLQFARNVKTGEADDTLAYLELDGKVHKGDSLNLTILDTSGAPIPQAQKVISVDDFQPFTFNLTPTSAPSEKLSNGNSRDVGQLTVELNNPDIFHWNQARTYLESNDLFSTDGKDVNSKIDGTFGLERNIITSWYVPFHLESKVQGNQTAQNLSYLAGLGLKTILPWGRTKPVLYNSFLQTPVSPVIAIDAQYERRINQDGDSLKKFPNQNSLRLAPAIDFKPIRLLPGLSQDLLDVEVTLKAWYLPFDQTAANGGKQRLEGASDVSLVIPIAKLNLLKTGLTFLNKDDPAKTQIRIKYSSGANEADGFKHSTHLTYGIEVSP